MDPTVQSLLGIQQYPSDDPVNGIVPPQPNPAHITPQQLEIMQRVGQPLWDAGSKVMGAIANDPVVRYQTAAHQAIGTVLADKLKSAWDTVTYPMHNQMPPSFADQSDPRTQAAIGNAASVAQRLISPAGAFRPRPGVMGSGVGGVGPSEAPDAIGPLMQKAPWNAPRVEPQGILAYHGSPHGFERFDSSKIGTGEGAQSFGHGLYFAGNEGVARSYRDQLTKTSHPDPATNIAVKSLAAGRTPDEAASTLSLLFPERSMADIRSTIQSAQDYKPPTGHMYEVNLQHNPEHMLDYDKPLSEQSQQVKDALKLTESQNWATNGGKYLKSDTLGHYLFDDTPISELVRSPEQAQKLKDAGIAGVKYFDRGSRAGGEGSRNYVAFDDKNIDILRKYGIPGLISASTAGGAAVQNLRDYMGGKEDQNKQMLQLLQQGGA